MPAPDVSDDPDAAAADTTRFHDLPDDTVTACVEKCKVPDLLRVLMVSRRLYSLAKDRLRSALACAACDAPVCFFEDVETKSMDCSSDGMACLTKHLSDASCYSAIASGYSLEHEKPAGQYKLSFYRCRRCTRYLGQFCYTSDVGHDVYDGAAISLTIPYLRGWPPTAPDRWRCPADTPGTALRCTGNVAATACNSVLAHAGAVLSNEHRWQLTGPDEFNQPAVYINHAASGALTLANERRVALAQGPMVVADAYCTTCHACVGWSFVECRLKRRVGRAHNAHYEGRHGLARSAFRCEAGDVWAGAALELDSEEEASEHGVEDDDDDEEEDEDDEEGAASGGARRASESV